MKTLIIGANGKIGSILASKLKNSAHTPVLMLRSEDQIAKYQKRGFETVFGDLEKDISGVFDGIEAVVFTAGSGADTGSDKTHLVDRLGAKKAIDEATRHKVKQFILVSALGADGKSEDWPENMEHYYAAKADADKYLLQSNLNYTIVMPGRLTDEQGTGNIELREKVKDRSASVSRTDVASLLAKLIGMESHYGQALELVQGDTPLNVAIEQLETAMS